MLLRTKMVLLIAVASVVPIVAATLIGGALVRRDSQRSFRAALNDAQEAVLVEYLALDRELRGTVGRLASSEDQFVGRILLALDRGNGELDAETARELEMTTSHVMRERGLEVLAVLGPRGRILASGHFRGQIGDTEPAHARFASLAASAASLLQEVRVIDDETRSPRTAVALLAARTCADYGQQVLVIAGKTISDGFFRRLQLKGGAVARIEDSKGHRLAGASTWTPYTGYPELIIPLGGKNQPQAVNVRVAVPDGTLRETLHAINVAALALIGSGLFLALLLGIIAARRITRPLSDLVEGAAAVAEGDLDRQIAPRRSDEIGTLVRAFNTMTRELKGSKERLIAAERVAAWQEIARRIAHEIKNPLFPIQTSIETLRKVHHKGLPGFDEIFEESTHTILEEVSRLKHIATEFSQFARMPKPQLAQTDLADVLQRVCNLYSTPDCPVTRLVAGTLGPVLADAEQLMQVFSNLVKNAVEATSGGAARKVELRAHEDGPVAVVDVVDNGPGVGASVRDQIFTPYFTTKDKRGGTGLGLAIVHRLVSEHGGEVTVLERTPDESETVFRVRLPRGISSAVDQRYPVSG